MRLVAASRGVVVSAERSGKQKTLTQILSIGAFLFADMVRTDLERWLDMDLTDIAQWGDWVGMGLFLLATVFTLTSGYNYFRKYGALVFNED